MSALFSVLSSVLVAASFPSPGIGWAAFAALAPLLLALRAGSVRRAVFLSFLFGYLHGIIVFRWLPSVHGVGYPVFLFLLAPLYSLYYIAFGVSYRLVAGRLPKLSFLAAPALWVTVEYARANMSFLSLPWNLLGHTQHAMIPVIGISDLAGVYGVSFLLVLVNEALSRWLEVFLPERNRAAGNSRGVRPERILPTAVAALVLILAVSWSLARSRTQLTAETVRMALVQPDLTVKEGMSYEDLERHFKIYNEFTLKAVETVPDLIAWPASSLPGSLYSRSVKVALGPLMKGLNVPLLVGGAGGEKMAPAEGDRRSYANTEFLLRPGGRPGGMYAKQHLVPFNEYLPLNGFVRWPPWITTLEGNYRPGTESTVFVLKKGRFGVPICWESLFPSLFRRFIEKGAQFMVNVTNEAYMGDTAGPYQTHAMNVFRAVENRIALARVSTTGISSFIAPDGRVMKTVQDDEGNRIFVAGILVGDIPLSGKKTFYTRHGDVFAWAVIFLSAGFLAASLRPGRAEKM